MKTLLSMWIWICVGFLIVAIVGILFYFRASPEVLKGKQGIVSIHRDKDVVVKTYNMKNNALNWSAYLTHVYALEVLRGEPHFPKLLHADPKTKTVTMQYCGDVLTRATLPGNWRQQLREIQNTAEKYEIDYIDTGDENFTVKDGVIYWVDVGSFMLRRHCENNECEPFKDKETLSDLFAERFQTD